EFGVAARYLRAELQQLTWCVKRTVYYRLSSTLGRWSSVELASRPFQSSGARRPERQSAFRPRARANIYSSASYLSSGALHARIGLATARDRFGRTFGLQNRPRSVRRGLQRKAQNGPRLMIHLHAPLRSRL